MPYHVKIRLQGASGFFTEFDKDGQWIEEHIATPRRKGDDIFFDGTVLSWETIAEIRIIFTADSSKQVRDAYGYRSSQIHDFDKMWIEQNVVDAGDDVTSQFITGRPGAKSLAGSVGSSAMLIGGAGTGAALPANSKIVMVIYGHDLEANAALFAWLRSIGLEPKEWGQLVKQTGSTIPYNRQVLHHALQSVQAIVVLFTPDERVCGRGSLQSPGLGNHWRLQARPNVLIEAGMALVTHPDRTILVTLGRQELPTDLAGLHYVNINGTAASLNDLASRLESAGCQIDRTGANWLDVTRFPNRDGIPAVPPGHK